MELSQRARSISLSVTLALDARAKALLADGRDIVNMSVGEPDFDAPEAAQAAACASVRGGAGHGLPQHQARPLERSLR